MSRRYLRLTLYRSQWSLSTRKEKDHQWRRHFMGHAVSWLWKLHRGIEDLSWKIPWGKLAAWRWGVAACQHVWFFFARLQRSKERQQLAKRKRKAKIRSHSSSSSNSNRFNSNKCMEISNNRWLDITTETCKIKIHHQRKKRDKKNAFIKSMEDICLADLRFISCLSFKNFWFHIYSSCFFCYCCVTSKMMGLVQEALFFLRLGYSQVNSLFRPCCPMAAKKRTRPRAVQWNCGATNNEKHVSHYRGKSFSLLVYLALCDWVINDRQDHENKK